MVDASALLPALTDQGGFGAQAREALRGGTLHAPELVDAEVLQTVRRKVLAGHWSPESGGVALEQLTALPLTLHSHRPLLPRCWQLRDAVSAYDAQYVALAEVLGATLVTADVRLSRAPGTRCEVRVLS